MYVRTNDFQCTYNSPPGTAEVDTNVTTDINGPDDKVLYAAPAQTATIPHQAAASGEQYAVSTKAVNKTSDDQPPSRKYDDAARDAKKDTQGVSTGVLVRTYVAVVVMIYQSQ